MKFIHVTKDHKKVFSKKKFRKPSIHKDGGLYQHNFNMDGAFYLSKADEDDSSMWLKYRELLQKYPAPPFKRYNRKTKTYELVENKDGNKDDDKDDDKEDPWINGKKVFFDVDFVKHNIYVVDTPDDLRNFFVKYGYFHQRVMYNHDLYSYNQDMHEIDEIRFKKLKYLMILNNFIDNLSNFDKDRMNDIEKIDYVKTIRNIRNMPHVEFKKKNVVVPKKGITFEFLVDLMRTKESFEKIIGDPSTLKISTYLRSINFPQMVKDGYNGLYYSTNLVKFVSQESLDKIYDGDNPHYNFGAKFIVRPDIGEMPEVMYFCNKKDMVEAKDAIEEYIRWIGSDTMILWKWIF